MSLPASPEKHPRNESVLDRIRTGQHLLGFPFLTLLCFLMTVPALGAPPPEITMAGGRTSVARGFELLDNRMFLSVWVNGQGPFKFILDSGAENLLTLDTAKKLGLKLKPAERQTGAGAGSAESWTTTVDSLNIGHLRMTRQSCMVVSLDPVIKAIGFERLDGLVGYELFRQLVVDLDYATGNVTFTRPEAFTPPEGCDEVPLQWKEHIPVVDGVVDGIAGRFLVDTGDRSSLTLFAPFVETNDLGARYPLTPEVTTGWGIGGPIPAHVTRIGALRVHQSDVPEVVTRLSTLKAGAFASSEEAGSIGTGVLKKFTVTFDYPNSRMFLRRNSLAGWRDTWDGAGMWLVRGSDGFEVFSVLKGGPADRAGIRPGDVITRINALDPSEQSLLDAREILSDMHAGAVVRILIREGQDSRVVDLVLEKIL